MGPSLYRARPGAFAVDAATLPLLRACELQRKCDRRAENIHYVNFLRMRNDYNRSPDAYPRAHAPPLVVQAGCPSRNGPARAQQRRSGYPRAGRGTAVLLVAQLGGALGDHGQLADYLDWLVV